MNTTHLAIPLWNLAVAFIPALAGLLICYRWSKNFNRASYSVLRMLVQLLLIGYLLTFIFATHSPLLVIGILLLMIGASSWIAAGSMGGSITRDGFRYVKYSLARLPSMQR